MTQEEKAKAYDEALEDMRAIYPNLKGDAKLAVEHAFPELTESDDERIREEMVRYFTEMKKGGSAALPYDDCIAYLERQKEQKPADEAEKFFDSVESYNQGFVAGQKKMKEDIEKGFGISEHSLDYLAGRYAGYAAARQEQEPAKWSDEDADMLNCCISSIEEAKENRYAYKETDGDTSYDREIDWLKSLSLNLKKKNEDVAKLCSNEWSKEDEAMIKSILFVLESYVSQSESASSPSLITTYPTYYKEIDFLKSLRPQPKKELSIEKAIQWLDDTFYFLDNSSGRGRDCEITTHDFDSLEEMYDSFRKAVIIDSEPHWKPSEEQMKALLNTLHPDDPYYHDLKSLYEQLKKL